MFNPSSYQSDISVALSSSSHNLIINAVAGSGKTTTLVWLLENLPPRTAGRFLPDQFLLLAFNKNIADELQRRCPKHVRCSTFHSLGFGALKSSGLRPRVDARKVSRLVFSHCRREDPDGGGIIRLVGLLKSAIGISVPDIIQAHSLSFENVRRAEDIAVRVLAISDADHDVIDFDDMLRLPVLLDCDFDQQDWVFVDEAQDLNSIQHDILVRLAKPMVNANYYGVPSASSTRYVFVGDPHQSIYGFRGAQSDSMEQLALRFAARSLPLSVCYRCSTAVVTEAQRVLALNW